MLLAPLCAVISVTLAMSIPDMKQNAVFAVVGVLLKRKVVLFYGLAHKCLIYVHKVAVL